MYTIPGEVGAISFDIWKTLLNGNKAFTRMRLRTIFDELGHTEIDVELLRTAYLRADLFYNNEAERMGRDFGMADRLRLMFEDLGIKAAVPEPEVIRTLQAKVGELRCQPQYMPTFIEPDVRETLKALRNQGFVLGLLSNTGMDSIAVMEPVLCQLGIWELFHTRVFTSEDGRAKPNPDLFRDTARLLGMEPHQVLHVGDNQNADCRAVEAGLHAVLYAPDGEPEGNTFPFVTSMKELLGK